MKNLKDNVKKYIYELFIISQCKTENEFRKNYCLSFLKQFYNFFLMNDCFI